MLLLLANLALADCAEPTDADSVILGLADLESELAAEEPSTETIAKRVQALEANLGCLGEPAPGLLLGRVFRGLAEGFHQAGQHDRAAAWLETAFRADTGFDPAEHAIYSEWFTEAWRVFSPLDDTWLMADGELQACEARLDGDRLDVAAAPPGLHLLQVQEAGRWRSAIIDGARFPPELIGAAEPDCEAAWAPKELPTRDCPGKRRVVGRALGVGLMIAGAGLAGGAAAGVYAEDSSAAPLGFGSAVAAGAGWGFLTSAWSCRRPPVKAP